jgi:hypothetical protein
MHFFDAGIVVQQEQAVLLSSEHFNLLFRAPEMQLLPKCWAWSGNC